MDGGGCQGARTVGGVGGAGGTGGVINRVLLVARLARFARFFQRKGVERSPKIFFSRQKKKKKICQTGQGFWIAKWCANLATPANHLRLCGGAPPLPDSYCAPAPPLLSPCLCRAAARRGPSRPCPIVSATCTPDGRRAAARPEAATRTHEDPTPGNGDARVLASAGFHRSSRTKQRRFRPVSEIWPTCLVLPNPAQCDPNHNELDRHSHLDSRRCWRVRQGGITCEVS